MRNFFRLFQNYYANVLLVAVGMFGSVFASNMIVLSDLRMASLVRVSAGTRHIYRVNHVNYSEFHLFAHVGEKGVCQSDG